MHHPLRKLITIAAAVAAVLGGSATALAANASSVRPHTAAGASTSTLTPLVQVFSTSTSPFCPAGTGNAPCDGAVGDYGTITRTPSGTGGIPALAGGEHDFAETAGSQATSAGCPSGASEYCTGPFALFGDSQLATFPTTGFTVTTDLYLTSGEPGDITADVSLNNSDGQYGDDEFINFCPVNGGLAISAGTMESCDGATAAQITKAGWYRLVWDFTPDAGHVALTQNVTSEATGFAVWNGELDAPVYLNGSTTQATVASAGGPGYFWIPTENVASLPLSNFAVQLGSHPGGNVPDQVRATTPRARITVSRAGTWLRFRLSAVSADGQAITGWTLTSPKLSGLQINNAGLVRGHVLRQRQTITATATDAAGVTGTVSIRLVVR